MVFTRSLFDAILPYLCVKTTDATIKLISHLYSASCFEDNSFCDNDTITTETMKQPLLSQHDSVPRKSELRSYCKDEERRASNRTMFMKILLAGFAAGLFLQVVAFSAFVTILVVWGGEPQLQDLSNRVMYYILFLLSQANIAVYSLINMIFFFFIIGTGPMYWRNKVDRKDTKGGLIWRSRKFLFRAGITFLFGIMFGSVAPWVVLEYKMGMPLSMVPLVITILLHLVYLQVLFRLHDWAHEEDEVNDVRTSTDEGQGDAGDTIV